MYLQHFGLAQYPFSLTPNTRYFLKLPSHQLAFDSLINALGDEGSFSKIIGEVGTGKTMLCRKVLNALEQHPDRFVTAYIPHPILSEEATLHAIAEELHIPANSGLKYRELLKKISEFTRQNAQENRQVVIFVDEAQAMPEESLNAIQLLTQAHAENEMAMQVILFGQPELEDLLARPILTQLSRSIPFSYVLPTLDKAGVEAYVQHRLLKAGFSGNHMFEPRALEKLVQHSGGVPRVINVLCHKALMVAFGKGDRVVNEKHMLAAIKDSDSSQKSSSWTDRFFAT